MSLSLTYRNIILRMKGTRVGLVTNPKHTTTNIMSMSCAVGQLNSQFNGTISRYEFVHTHTDLTTYH